MTKNKILLVDDEPSVLSALKRAMADEDFDIRTVEGGEEALDVLKIEKFKVIISDEKMPGMAGSELLSIIALQHPETVRITLTGHASIDSAVRAVNEGEVFKYLLKPWDNFDLVMAVNSAIEKYDENIKNRELLAMARTQL